MLTCGAVQQYNDNILTLINQKLRMDEPVVRLTKARLGYEGSFEFVAPTHNAGETMAACESSTAWLNVVLPDVRWTDATSLLNQLRATKTLAEVARLRVAHRIAA